MKIRGIIRLVAIAVACTILLPIIFNLYLMISPDSGTEDIGHALVEAIPMGTQILYTINAFLSPTTGGMDSSLESLLSSDLMAQEAIIIDMAQLFLVAVIILALKALIKGWFATVDTGLIVNQLANILVEILFVFTASLFANFVYNFFIEQVSTLTGTSQDVILYTVAAISFVGGIAALIFGGGILRSSLQVSLKMLEAVLTYAMCIILLLSLAPWYFVVPVWILMIWAFHFLDSLF
jgi:hypothetical protein